MATRRKPASAPVVVEDEVEEIEELEEVEDGDVEELDDSDEDVEELTDDEDTEVEELEDGEDVEELEEEPEEDPKPKAKTRKPAAAKATPPKKTEIEHDSNWLATYVNEVCGTTYDARGIRMLLRKLARSGTLERTVGEDRGRYAFTGPGDTIVKAVIKMVKSGEADEMKKAELAAMKTKVAEKRAKEAEEAAAPAKPAPAKKTTPAKAAPTKAAATKATPAKAAAAPAKATTTRRRTTTAK